MVSTCGLLRAPWAVAAHARTGLDRNCQLIRAIHGEQGAARKAGVVFLGTPNVAADMLDSLLDASHAEDSIFEVVGVVTQPPSMKGRGRKQSPSPVAQRALDRRFPTDFIFSPEKAGEETFLEQLRGLNPDLCITAAYGNILPQRFLDIPQHGTVNVHPSLLPLYRGAAPVQRAVQDGVKVTGVTVAYTVRALDSGPIIASQSTEVDPDIKAPELQAYLFAKGTSLLLLELPHLLDGTAAKRAQEQDHSRATLAPKISVKEAWLSFEEPAVVLHNKVRAFAEWPGTKAKFELRSRDNSEAEVIEIRVVTTKTCECEGGAKEGEEVVLRGDGLLVECGKSSFLQILEVQPQGRKVVSARAFWNGLQDKQLRKIKYEEFANQGSNR